LAVLEGAKELRKIWGVFRASRVLLTANNFKVFDYLERPQSARIIARKIHTDLRATEILLDALTGLELLKKENNRYTNTKKSSRFLVSGKPYYQGDIIRHADTLWKNWSCLDEIVQKGKPQHKVHNHADFILGMHNIASLKAKDIVRKIGLKGVISVLDIGGGPGTYSAEIAKKNIRVTLFDLPETIRIAKRLIPENQQKNIHYMSGDFLYDDIGNGYNLVFISQVLHSYTAKVNLQLLRKCRKALNKKGKIAIHEFHISNDRTHPAHSALFSVNMLVNTESGRCYSPQEIGGWLLKIGCKKVIKDFFDDTVLLTGYL
jgi:2-polyprenyl-3-methyl-5-hydroxy-6-metoxy-1,4-benzoquinol methylase